LKSLKQGEFIFMTIYVSTLITFIALIAYVSLLVIILKQRVNSWVRGYFGLYLFSMIIWSFAAFIIFSSLPGVDELLWNRVLIVGSMATPVTFYGFVVAFLGRRRLWIKMIGVAGYLVSQVLNLQGLVVTSATMQDGLLLNSYDTTGLVFVSVFWLGFLSASALELASAYRRSKDASFRNRLGYLIMVIIVIFSGNLSNLGNLKTLPLDVAFNILSAILITIAILRHHLLDFSLVVRKGMLYSIPTMLIAVAYFLIIQSVFLLFPTFSSFEIFLISITAAILTALVMDPLRNRAQSMIDRVFFREKYDAGQMLERISRAAAFELDLETLSHMIVSEVTGTLHIRQAAFFIKGPESSDYVLTAQFGLDDTIPWRWSHAHPVVMVLSQYQGPLSCAELATLPHLAKLSQRESDDLDCLHGELFIPLKAKEQLAGFLVLGVKQSEETYSDTDILSLSTLANQTAVAIEKARLFSAEQARREELDSLYDLTRQLAATNEVDTIIQSATRHVVASLHVTFARILIPNEKHGFYCRSAYPIRSIHYDLGIDRFEPEATRAIYEQAAAQHDPVFLNNRDAGLSDPLRHALMLDLARTLCLMPLYVGEQSLGLLVLGERREAMREPFDADKLRLLGAVADQVANALYRASLFEQLEETLMETMLALATAMDARDTYTSNHSQRLSALAESIGRDLNFEAEQLWDLRWAAMLHDIGKIGVPDEVLRKKSLLTEEEWQIMRRHPEIGARIVSPVKRLAVVSVLIRCHHEWYDGTGYPRGLKGNQIPLGARILTIVDAYSAMTDDRIYRDHRANTDALNELRSKAGTQFDPMLVEVFINLVEKDRIQRPAQMEPITSRPTQRNL
jgi:HD-GYP domain-containing protein (c-di-GMP phosphodiesterase class II)